jgi:hypothetical protein
MADGGGGMGGDVHMHVHALDAKDVKNYLHKNSHVLAPAMRKMARNFSPTSGSMSPLGSHA